MQILGNTFRRQNTLFYLLTDPPLRNKEQRTFLKRYYADLPLMNLNSTS